MKPTLAQVVTFLRLLEDQGLGYGAINTARCALSVVLPRIDGETVGKHHVISWFVRSVYERNPPKPRYDRFWDVTLVFNLIKSWPKNVYLSHKNLSFKLIILLLLVTGHRGQTIVALSIKNLEINDKEARFEMEHLTKSNRLGDPLSTVKLIAYKLDKKLCVVATLREYLSRTQNIRKSDQLLISYIKPHGPVSRDTLARWTINVLKLSGVDTNRYSAHSTRGAMVSKAKLLGVSVKAILKHAGWKTEHAFAKHYDKRVEKHKNIARTLLKV